MSPRTSLQPSLVAAILEEVPEGTTALAHPFVVVAEILILHTEPKGQAAQDVAALADPWMAQYPDGQSMHEVNAAFAIEAT